MAQSDNSSLQEFPDMVFTIEDDNENAPIYWAKSLDSMRSNRNRSDADPVAELSEFQNQRPKSLFAREDILATEQAIEHWLDIEELVEIDEIEPTEIPETKVQNVDLDLTLNLNLELDSTADVDWIGKDWLPPHESQLNQINEQNLTENLTEIIFRQPENPENTSQTIPKNLFNPNLNPDLNFNLNFNSLEQKISQEPLLDISEQILDGEELTNAYHEYLAYREQAHNQTIDELNANHAQNPNQQDIGILIKEDWLSAQIALKSERMRRYQTLNETLVLGSDMNSEFGLAKPQNQPTQLNQLIVHVYDLPQLPSTQKIRILSEQELMDNLTEKLLPHLSNAVAGMVRQVLQKKLAHLSYELQMMLNEETPNLVEDVLAHNMSAIMKQIKENL